MQNLIINDLDDIGKILKKVRLEKGISIAELSAVSGIGQRAIYHIECGRSMPHLTTLEALITILGYDSITIERRK